MSSGIRIVKLSSLPLALLLVWASAAYAMSGPFSLADCIRIALARNPAYQGSRLAAEAATKEIGSARAAFLPQIGFDGSFLETSPTSLVPTWAAISVGKEYEPLILDQPLYDRGIAGKFEAAKANGEVARADAQVAGGNLVDLVMTDYFQVLQASDSVAIARLNRAGMQSQLAAAIERNRTGDTPRIDVSRAELALDNASAELEGAEGALASARIALGSLLGMGPEFEIQPMGRRSLAPLAASLPSLLLEAESHRPELVAAKARLKRAHADLAVAESARYPKVHLEGAYGWYANNPDLSYLGWEAEINVKVPLIDWDHSRDQIDAARLQYAQVRKDFDGQKLAIDQEVREAAAQLQTAAAQVKYASRSVDEAQQTVRMAEKGFLAGNVSNLDLLLSDRQWMQARLQESSVYYQSLVAQAKLRWAIGELTP